MSDVIDVKSLMRISKFAKLNNKSAAWVHSLAKEDLIDLIVIDEFHFVKINAKALRFITK